MPILKNVRQEMFAVALAKGMSADEAYVEAGYKENHGNAGRLKANEAVQERVAEIQRIRASKLDITISKLQYDLQRAMEMALEKGQLSVVVAAAREQAVLAGLRVEKHDTTQRFEDADAISDEELLRVAMKEETGNEAGTKAPEDATKH